MFLSDEDFEISEVLERTTNGEYVLARIEGTLEEPERLRESDRLLTAGRSRFARTFIHGIGIPEVIYSGTEGRNLHIETENLNLSSKEEGIGLTGPFSCVTDPVDSSDLEIDGNQVSLYYLVRDSRALLDEDYSGVKIEEGTDIARLGGFNIEDIAMDFSGPVPDTHSSQNDSFFSNRLEGLRADLNDVSDHPSPPAEAYNQSDYQEGQILDPRIDDPEYTEEGIFEPVEGENPDNNRTNSFVGDTLEVPLENQAYQPADERFSNVEELEELELEDIQRPVDTNNYQRFGTVLAKTQEPITYDGFYTVILKVQSGGEHVHSVVGDPFFEDPMILEYQNVYELPANARALLIEKD